MKSFFGAFLGTLAALFFMAIAAAVAIRRGEAPPRIPDHATLVLPVGGDDSDYPSSGIQFDGPSGTSQTELLEAFEKAAVDKRIDRVLLRLSLYSGGYARAEELRGAIHRFRESGKPVIAWADYMDERTYAVAAACDTIYMLTDAPFLFSGFRSTRSFYKGTLDKLGVQVQMERIESYKSAAESFMRHEMSPESRAMSTRLLNDQVTAVRAALEKERGITAARFDSLLASPVLLSTDAARSGLINGTIYYEDLLAGYAGEKFKRPRIVSAGDYVDVERAGLGLAGKRTIAVVHGQGLITPGRSTLDPFLGEILGSDTMIRELRRVADDRDVDAIVLRLDTGGGETWASDAIGHEVERIATKKPVVISMGDLCASGGYSIAYRATALVALPSTLTGSIGSFLGKANVSGLYEKLGVTHDAVQFGPHAGMASPLQSWSPEEEQMIREQHWDTYRNWIADIAQKRGLAVADLDSIARGRVWTGREALPLKLVDRLGDLKDAIEEAKSRAKIPADEKVTVEHYPKPRRPLEALLEGRWSDLTLGLAARSLEDSRANLDRLSQLRSWSIMGGEVP